MGMASLATVIWLFISTPIVVGARKNLVTERLCSQRTSASSDADVASARAFGNEETDPNFHGISSTISNSASLSDEVKLVLMKHGIQTDNQNLISDLVALATRDKPTAKNAPHATLQLEENDLRAKPSKGDPDVTVWTSSTNAPVTNLVFTTWHSIPIDFRIEGKINDIKRFLTMKGVWHKEVRCHENIENKHVWLVVTESATGGLTQWRQQVAGFFGLSGLGATATTLGAALEVSSETFKTIADAVQMVATNPASDIDDWAAEALQRWDNSDSLKINRLRTWWSGVTGRKYIAFLTESDPVLKGKTGAYARFKCMKTEGDKYVVMSEPCQREDVTSTQILAPHLAMMIPMMAGF